MYQNKKKVENYSTIEHQRVCSYVKACTVIYTYRRILLPH
jgi:hypothetical protein